MKSTRKADRFERAGNSRRVGRGKVMDAQRRCEAGTCPPGTETGSGIVCRLSVSKSLRFRNVHSSRTVVVRPLAEAKYGRHADLEHLDAESIAETVARL
jgi:hypothetical protein